MPTASEVEALLAKLEDGPADDLESQELDFMEWSEDRHADPRKVLLEKVICMANGGGGTIVVGVRDRVKTRKRAILGVPASVDMTALRRSVLNATRPTITATFERLAVSEGHRRLFVVQVVGGTPPYTDARGAAKIREGKECVPFDGAMLRDKLAAAGVADLTAEEVPGSLSDLVSEAGVERLREMARAQDAPAELLRRPTPEFLRSLGLIGRQNLRKAGLLLVGQKEKIAEHFPGFQWSYLRMTSGSAYRDRIADNECVAIALGRIEDRINANNPIVTVERQLLHLEFRTYPVVAIREALLNAFGHADYRISGIIQIKQFDDRLEIANPGGFIGGVTSDNILNHAPVPRNPALVAALDALHLVNRSNLGVRRIYEAMLREGKESPTIRDVGASVQLTLRAGEFSPAFLNFVQDEAAQGHWLEAEHLLVLRYLVREDEIRAAHAARITQRDQSGARDVFRQLESWGIVQQSGKGSTAVWRLRVDALQKLAGESMSVIDAAFVRVRDELERRHRVGQVGLSASEIRELSGLNEQQVKYLTQKFRSDKVAAPSSKGPGATWSFTPPKPVRKKVARK